MVERLQVNLADFSEKPSKTLVNRVLGLFRWTGFMSRPGTNFLEFLKCFSRNRPSFPATALNESFKIKGRRHREALSRGGKPHEVVHTSWYRDYVPHLRTTWNRVVKVNPEPRTQNQVYVSKFSLWQVYISKFSPETYVEGAFNRKIVW